MTTLLTSRAKEFLSKLNAAARKKLGQNFMVRESELAFIADALQLKEGEPVLEIGPGLGFLTAELLNRGARVLAIEKDAAYADFLAAHFADRPFQVLKKDVLGADLEKDFGVASPIKVVGNIPYNITSPIIAWLIAQKRLVSEAVLTVQWEVAQRLTAQPGGKIWGSLSVFAQFYADVSLIRKIGRDHFYPAPKVDSAVIRIVFLKAPRFQISSERQFFGLVRRAFQQRRKTVLNSLFCPEEGLTKLHLEAVLAKAEIASSRRPETLSLEEWGTLTRLCYYK